MHPRHINLKTNGRVVGLRLVTVDSERVAVVGRNIVYARWPRIGGRDNLPGAVPERDMKAHASWFVAVINKFANDN